MKTSIACLMLSGIMVAAMAVQFSTPDQYIAEAYVLSQSGQIEQAIELMESDDGQNILDHLQRMTRRFETGLQELGYEMIESEHPIVPLMVRDTKKTAELVNFLIEHGILVTGLNFPVVPRGDEEIRFQINANHTPNDIDTVLKVLKKWKNKR